MKKRQKKDGPRQSFLSSSEAGKESQGMTKGRLEGGWRGGIKETKELGSIKKGRHHLGPARGEVDKKGILNRADARLRTHRKWRPRKHRRGPSDPAGQMRRKGFKMARTDPAPLSTCVMWRTGGRRAGERTEKKKKDNRRNAFGSTRWDGMGQAWRDEGLPGCDACVIKVRKAERSSRSQTENADGADG